MIQRLITMKEILGLALVTLIPSAALSLPAVLGGKLNDVVWAFPVITAVAAVVSIVIGLPAIMLFNWFGLLGLQWYIVIGLAVSLVLAAYFIFPNAAEADLSLGWAAYAAQYVILLFLSLLVTAIYWLAVRPDRIRGQ